MRIVSVLFGYALDLQQLREALVLSLEEATAASTLATSAFACSYEA